MSNQQRKKNPSAFLRNIFQILQNDEFKDIIEWAPTGNGFVIKDLPCFQATILPQFFKHKKYSSFVRQLNMYGFHKQRNTTFQNCFLHDQFRRGNELPTDIKRKPEKKKKVGEQSLQILPKSSQNWFSFTEQLRQHFPHIAENILMKNENQVKKIIVLSGQNSVSDKMFQDSAKILRQGSEQEQEYVSKISLKGLIDDFEQHSKSNRLKFEGKVENSNVIDNQVRNHQLSDSISQKMSSESLNNQFSDFKSESKVVQKQKQHQSIKREWSFSNCETLRQNATIRNNFDISFISGFGNSITSMTSLSQALVRQNLILCKAHPVIRTMVLKSQQNKISYLNHELQSIQKHEIDNQTDFQSQNTKLKNILQSQRQEVVKLTSLLTNHAQFLNQLAFNEQDNPISTTSIKFRLERLD